MDFSHHKSVLHRNKFKVVSLCSFVRFQKSTKQVKQRKLDDLFVQNFFKNMIAWLARAQMNTSTKQTVKNKWKHVVSLDLPCLFDNMDSKVEYRFPLPLKRQSNLNFWPYFDEKLWISVLNGRSPTKTARNFQSTTGSLLRRQYIHLIRWFNIHLIEKRLLWALAIGHWAAIVWAYGNNEMLCLSDRQTIASQYPIANAQSNLFSIRCVIRVGILRVA